MSNCGSHLKRVALRVGLCNSLAFGSVGAGDSIFAAALTAVGRQLDSVHGSRGLNTEAEVSFGPGQAIDSGTATEKTITMRLKDVRSS